MNLEPITEGSQFITVPAVEPDRLTILLWLWRDSNYSIQYKPEHANTAARMIHRNLTIPHRFVLLTDQLDADYDPLITPVKLWDDWRELVNTAWGKDRPQCYVRLKAFSEEAEEILGKRFVSIDLDCLVVKNIDSLFTRPEDFVIFRRPRKRQKDRDMVYQGSMWMMNAGARAQVWKDFKGEESIAAAQEFIGSDQAWMRHILGPNEAGWDGEKDGVYGWYWEQRDSHWRKGPLPNARIIFFNTTRKPWDFDKDPGHPTCGQCGAPVTVEEPYSLVFNKSLGSHGWIRKFYH